MSSNQKRFISPVIFMLLAALLLAACGGEAASGPTSTSGTTTESYINVPLAYPTGTAGAAYYAASPTDTPAAASVMYDKSEMRLATAGLNPMVGTQQDHLSTIALEVDTGSYTQARSYINAGALPPADTVRIEEFVNYFNYHYVAPEKDAFAIHIDSAPSPFNGGQTDIVRVGVQGRRIDAGQRDAAVLTFVIDVSGSMADDNKLPLVKQALRLLVDELRQGDKVGIVVFGSDARVVLEPTDAANKDRIIAAINGVESEGSTNTEEGLRLGYQMAGKFFKNGANNRVVLCSDGVANVGATGPDAILDTIGNYAAQGIYLTTVGFGMGEYNDTLMEQLADKGNGGYAYVDSLNAAQRIFVQDLTGTVQIIAKDAKAQIDFNPDVVSSYRLLGYENRAIADGDFRNDKVDAGEIGSGHSATALYEIVRRPNVAGDALTVQIRYADPKSGEVTELRQPFASAAFGTDFASSKADFQLAVAAAGFAEHLRPPGMEAAPKLDMIKQIAQRIAPQLGNDAEPQELLQLMTAAEKLGS